VTEGSRVDWRPWFAPLLMSCIVLVTGLLYWPSTQSLLHEWFETENSAYSHGPLAVLVALWLGTRALRGGWPREAGSVWPVLLLVAASFAWLIVLRAGIQAAHQALVPLIIALILWCALGWRLTRRVAVPVGLLYSAVPVWHVAIPALQALTVAVVGVFLRIAGITAYVVDDYVYIRSGAFHIEDGCAGLHYFVVAATLAVIYGELRRDSWRVRAALLALAVSCALVGNWLRVFVIIVAGDLTNMQHHLVRVEHGNFGWAVFAAMMVVFVLIARNWGSGDVAPAAHAVPTDEPGDLRRSGALRAAALAAVVSAAGPAWLVLMPVRTASAPNISIAATLTGWDGPHDSCQAGWHPRYDGADLQAQQEFARAGRAVCAYVATYLSQRQDKELIGYFNLPYARNAELVSSAAREVEGRAINEVQLGGKADVDRIVWFGYFVGARGMRRGVEAQLAYGVATLAAAPASSVYAISADCVPDCASARRLLGDFLPNIRVGNAGEKGT